MRPLSPRKSKLNKKRWWHKLQLGSRRKKWRPWIWKDLSQYRNRSPLSPWNKNREPTVFSLMLCNWSTSNRMMSRIWTPSCYSAKSLQSVISSFKKISYWNKITWKNRRNSISWWRFKDWNKLRRKNWGIKRNLRPAKKLDRWLSTRLMKNSCKDKRIPNWEIGNWCLWRRLRSNRLEMRKKRSKRNKLRPRSCLWKLRRPTSNRCCSRKRKWWRTSKILRELKSTTKKRLMRITRDKLRLSDWNRIVKGIWPCSERHKRRSPIKWEISKVKGQRELSNKVKETPEWETNWKLTKSNAFWKTWTKPGKCNSKLRRLTWLNRPNKKEMNSCKLSMPKKRWI